MRFAIVTLLSVFISGLAFAQSTAGLAAISGVVRDSEGSPIPNAQVVVSNSSQGVMRRITSNHEGVFTAPSLLPGAGYEISVTATGFAPYDAKDMDLRVG